MANLFKLLIAPLILTPYSDIIKAEEQDLCYSHNTDSTFIDTSYHYLNSTFCQPAIWFDSFFIDEHLKDDARAGSMVRWYNDLKWSESNDPDYKTSLRARLYLPNVTKRLKLIFESDDQDEPFNTPSASEEETKDKLGLRYDKPDKGHGSYSIKVTLRPSIEARYRYKYTFSPENSATFTQKIYQKENMTGESTDVDLDHFINEKFLLRWTNFANFETDIDGFKFGSGLTLFHYISPKKAINYKASMTAPNKPHHYISNSHLSLTYRQNILRKWLFYEITPEINWNKTAETVREQQTSITFRLEVLFKNI